MKNSPLLPYELNLLKIIYKLEIVKIIDYKESMLLRLNQMLCYALCLSYHSNTEAVLFA